MIKFEWFPKEGTNGTVFTCHKPQFDLEAKATESGAEWSVTSTANRTTCASGTTKTLEQARSRAGGWVFDFFCG